MANEIDALLNVKDASGVLNEIYPITKKENVQGLAELVNSAVSGKADKTALDSYSLKTHTHDDRYYTESEINTKLGSYLPKSGGTMTGALTLNGAPTADLQAATKKYVDDSVSLVINASSITSAATMNSALTSINSAIGKREVIFYKDRSYRLTYADSTSAIFACVDNGKIYTATLISDMDSISYDTRNVSVTQRTVTLSSTGWTASGSVYTQSATVSGVSATETAQEIHVTPASASMSAYMEAGVYASGQAANQITFTASKKPTVNLTVYAVIRTL